MFDQVLIIAAPFEALIPASIADIWHVHERGFRMAIFNLGVLGGIVCCSQKITNHEALILCPESCQPHRYEKPDELANLD